MPKKKSRFHALNPAEVLDVLVRAGKTTWAEITKMAEIADLERRLKALRGEMPGPFTRKRVRKAAKRAKRAVSAEVVATRKIQGQYIAHLRKFPKNARGKFQKIARTKSREEAIAAM